MIHTKTKPHFWPQLFLSLIAIFALPTVSSLENQSVNHNNLSNEQRQTVSYTAGIAILVKQVQNQKLQPNHSVVITKILHKIEPHFFSVPFFRNTPIRAGPYFTA
ncbi:uncharacterized protein DUF2547 [Bisgaardia hudsonensis]|uniref:Uncharacterized protein DUF2547 n=1 Tax=Bisgaardia hudsonensis TaxID=109472 RepID=A0A4R2N0B7_9PAST|nr:secA translation cis-regulator SecM [Bisgaardia hudsonensis]QLB13414.1 hypothetical protein A6A11_07230 [Bisgaardia hudsonensis]TCP12819.1 uncharacterized protein DUF2547 [Bisgaardia hudsonensis]